MNKFSLFLLLCVVLFFVSTQAVQLDYDWTVSFSHISALGVNKRVIVINDQFPGPLLNTTTDDVVNINVHNNLNEPFLFTWNGVQMRRNSWQDGVQETNCPIMPGKNWTYSFQMKDEIGSFFYYPSLLFQKAAGGYGPIRINCLDFIFNPCPKPDFEYDILIGDWFNADYQELRQSLDVGNLLPLPNGILINGFEPHKATFDFEPGATYRLRISNVGLKTTINFRIQDHTMLLVETEGSHTLKQNYDNLDIHVGQSYSVIVTALSRTDIVSFYMLATSRFISQQVVGVGIVRYSGFQGVPLDIIPSSLPPHDIHYYMNQTLSIRLDLSVGASRAIPQGSYHYRTININRSLILRNGAALIDNKFRYTVNGVSFVHPDTPLKLADYFNLSNIFEPRTIPDVPNQKPHRMGVSVIDATYHDFLHVVFHNPLLTTQTWHSDGNNFFVVGMGMGIWDQTKMGTYNMVDAIYRSTIQVYPSAWTAILIKLDNHGLWNLRSQDAEREYLGQELYIRVKMFRENPRILWARDEAPIPENVILCGRAAQAW